MPQCTGQQAELLWQWRGMKAPVKNTGSLLRAMFECLTSAKVNLGSGCKALNIFNRGNIVSLGQAICKDKMHRVVNRGFNYHTAVTAFKNCRVS